MSPAIAPGTRACIGLPQATCEQAFQEADARRVGAERSSSGSSSAAQASARPSGEAERSVTYADGTSEQSSFGWQQAAPAPVGQPVGPEPSLAVSPTCVGSTP